MSMRKQFEGTLTVFRDSSLRETLSAEITLSDGTTFYYNQAPKSFKDLITDPIKNRAKVTLIANDNGTNPRSVKLIGQPY